MLSLVLLDYMSQCSFSVSMKHYVNLLHIMLYDMVGCRLMQFVTASILKGCKGFAIVIRALLVLVLFDYMSLVLMHF